MSTELNSVNSIINDPNLKAYYRFESGALTTDSSGEGHTLTAISDPAEDVSGKFGGAVALDGNDAYSAVDHADFKPNGNFTVGAWIKTSTASSQQVFQSFDYVSSTTYAGFLLRTGVTSGKASLYSAKNTGIIFHTDGEEVYGTVTVTDGNWHFIVGTWDGSYLRIYTDGGDMQQVAWAHAPAYQATNNIRIGCYTTTTLGTTTFFTGSLDDVFLINGTALSSDQIASIYDGTINSVSPSISYSISASVSSSVSPSPSISISASPSVSPSISPSVSPSVSKSASPSISPSVSPSLSPSISKSISVSVSPSFSQSLSPSRSPSLSPSISQSISASISPSRSLSVSPSISLSISPSVSPSPSRMTLKPNARIIEIKPRVSITAIKPHINIQ